MRRRSFIALAGLAGTATLAGCITRSAGDEPTIEDLTVEQTERETIAVSAQASVETEPNMAVFTASVEATDREDADAVVEEVAAKANQVKEALLDYGVDEDDITTDRYDLGYSSRRNQYEGTHRYAIEVDDPDDVGELIDVVVDAGADDIGGVNFTVDDDRHDELFEDAVDKVVEEARTEAEMYAQAAGKSVGEPISIETTGGGPSPFYVNLDHAVATESAEAAQTQIVQGDVTVSASVEIEYELE